MMASESPWRALDATRSACVERDAFLHALITVEEWGQWLEVELVREASLPASDAAADMVDALVGFLSVRTRLLGLVSRNNEDTQSPSLSPTLAAWTRELLR